eukprot:gene55791-61942_t
MKRREGRGFTLAEVKAAGLCAAVLYPKGDARSIGIAVDHRRKNKSEESLQRNVQRLNEYKSKLVLYPMKAGLKVTKGAVADASKDQLTKAEAPRELSKEEKTRKVYNYLRAQNRNEKFIGYRMKRNERKAAKATDEGTAVKMQKAQKGGKKGGKKK